MGRVGGNNGLDLDELHGGPVTGSRSEINGMGIQGYFLVRVSFSIGLFLCFFTRFYLTFLFATYLLVGGFVSIFLCGIFLVWCRLVGLSFHFV